MSLLQLLEDAPDNPRARAEAMGFDTSRVLYHGGDTDVDQFVHLVWFSVEPALANQYAELRGSELPRHVKPCYARKGLKTFDAGRDDSGAWTVGSFISALADQGAANLIEPTIQYSIARKLMGCARTEESGPHYSVHDFWYQTWMNFGPEGAGLIKEIWEKSGFEAISYTEDGHQTLGVFNPRKNIRGVFAQFRKPEGGLLEAPT